MAATKASPVRPKTSFAGDVLKLVSGTAFAQLLGILASPILTRMYAPEAFGLVAIFTSITSILGVVVCLRYELAIMLPESDEEAANLLGISLMFTVLITLLTFSIVWWGGGILLRWLNAPKLAPYLWLAPVAVFFAGIFTSLNYWNSRTKKFGRLSIARVTASLATTTAQLGAGFAGYATGGMMIGASIGGSVLATTVLGGQIWRDDRNVFMKSIRLHDLTKGIKRYRKFPLYDTWSGLLNTISVQLPALLLSSFFSPLTVGLYALGYRLLNVPMSLIGSAIGQVFYQRASVANIEQKLGSVVKNTSERLLKLGVFPFLLLMTIGPDFFVVVFGVQWADAGIYMRILAPWLFFVFIGSPISTLFSVLEVQEAGLLFNVVLVISRAASLVIGGLIGNILLALTMFSISGTALWIWLCFYLFTKSGLSVSTMSRVIMRYLLIAVLFVTPTIVTKWMLNTGPFLSLFVGLVSGVMYYLAIISQDDGLKSLAFSILKRRKVVSP